MISMDALTFTPYNGNMLNSSFKINKKDVKLNQTRWGACQVDRKSDET